MQQPGPSQDNGKPSGPDSTLALQAKVVERMWSELGRRMSLAGLERVRGLLDVAAGRIEPPLMPTQGHQQRWFMPDLPSSPWLAREPLEDIALELESRFDELRDEVLNEIGTRAFRPYGLAAHEPAVPRAHLPAGWDELKLWDGAHPTPAVLKMPVAARTLRAILDRDRLTNQFTYLAMKPGTRLPPHSDRGNWLVSVQMGIVVPQGCAIRVGGDARTWPVGGCLFFDNSFEHEAWNDSDSLRVVLAVHLGHPSLTQAERQALRLLQDMHLVLGAAGPEAMAAWANTRSEPLAGSAPAA